MKFKSFLSAVIGLLALFGLFLGSILFFAPEKLHEVSESLTAVGQKNYRLPDAATPQSTLAEVAALKSFSKVFVNLARNTRPSVVFISTSKMVQQRRFMTPEEFFFSPFFGPGPDGGQGGGRRQQGAGSGFIVDLKNGYVLTNHHVIEGADEISVTTFDDRRFKAVIVGSEKTVDVAVLRVEGLSGGSSGLKQVTLGDSDQIEMGDWVAALGAPFQLPQTLTVGIVSALGRNSVMGNGTIEDFIQTDAAINPGNSGGPLLNLDGQVIGMNTAIYSASGGSAGIGFAVPSNMARKVAEMLINEGKVTRGYLGIVMQDFKDLSPEVLKRLNASESTQGALISEVREGSPAETAGLKPYDIITAINGSQLQNSGQLRARIAFIKPGTEIKVTVLRDGKNKDLSVRIGSFNDAEQASNTPNRKRQNRDDEALEITGIGLTVSNISTDLRKQLGIRAQNGVLITAVEERSSAAFAQLRRGDVILEVNKKPMRTARDVKSTLEDPSTKDKDLLFLIEREGRTILVVLRQNR